MKSLKRLDSIGQALFLAGILISTSGCMAEVDEGDTDAVAADIGEGPVAEATQAITWNGHNYFFVLGAQTWDQARSTCLASNYYLVTINSASEETWLGQQETALGGDVWWIGYNDKGYEGTWIWEGGSNTYKNWAAGQPDDYFWSGGEDCAVDNYSSGKWNDMNCGGTHRAICERNY